MSLERLGFAFSPLAALDTSSLGSLLAPAARPAGGDAIEAGAAFEPGLAFNAGAVALDASTTRSTTAADLLAARGFSAVVAGAVPSSPPRAREHHAAWRSGSVGIADPPAEWARTRLGKGLEEFVPALRNALDHDTRAYYLPLVASIQTYNATLDRETRGVDAALAKDEQNGSLRRLEQRHGERLSSKLNGYHAARAEADQARGRVQEAELMLGAAEDDLRAVEAKLGTTELGRARRDAEAEKQRLEREKQAAKDRGGVAGVAAVDRQEGLKAGAEAVGSSAMADYYDRKIAAVDAKIAELDARIDSVEDEGLRAEYSAAEKRLRAARAAYANAAAASVEAERVVGDRLNELAVLERDAKCGGSFFQRAYAAHQRLGVASANLASATASWDARLASSPYWQSEEFAYRALGAGGGKEGHEFAMSLAKQVEWQHDHRANNARIIGGVASGRQYSMLDDSLEAAHRHVDPAWSR